MTVQCISQPFLARSKRLHGFFTRASGQCKLPPRFESSDPPLARYLGLRVYTVQPRDECHYPSIHKHAPAYRRIVERDAPWLTVHDARAALSGKFQSLLPVARSGGQYRMKHIGTQYSGDSRTKSLVVLQKPCPRATGFGWTDRVTDGKFVT